jgi:hypothetical protein
MSRAAALFGKTRPGDAIYLITDGGANSGRESHSQLSDQMLRGGIRVFVFLVGSQEWRPRAPVEYAGIAGVEALFGLEKRTGGGEPEFPYATGELIGVNRPPRYIGESWNAFWKYGRFSMLRPALDALYSRMTDYYGVELFRSGNVARKAKVRLSIADSQGKRIKRIEVDYPHQIAACSPSKSH